MLSTVQLDKVIIFYIQYAYGMIGMVLSKSIFYNDLSFLLA